MGVAVFGWCLLFVGSIVGLVLEKLGVLKE